MNITLQTFNHPEDIAALEKLKAIPLFSTAVKAFMKVFNERQLHGMNMAQKIRLGPNQLPEIYSHLPPICEALNINEPELYLEMSPFPNAYTYGDTQVFITLTSALIEYLDEDELQAVIAHECGHILFHHTLYRTMTMILFMGNAQLFDMPDIISTPIKWALLYWFRRSELSADRAAAVALKSPKPMIESMIRFSGGPKTITDKVNIDLYIEQANAYDNLLEDSWDKTLQYFAVKDLEHPFASVRTRELSLWCDTEEFIQLLSLSEEMKKMIKCKNCRAPIEADWKFCGCCGYQF